MPARVILKPGKASPFIGRHPWLFSGAVSRIDGEPGDGDEVAVCDQREEFIARGLYNSRSQIQVRLYSWDPDRTLDEAFWRERLEAAIRLRQSILGRDDPEGAVRLVFSEADGLSGLVVDRYRDWLIVQLTSLAMARRMDVMIRILAERLSPRGIYLRTEKGIGETEGLEIKDGPLAGEPPPETLRIAENALGFDVDVRTGQKTGFYLDQRENRMALAAYASHIRGGRALDLACYTGGFSLNLARLGAAEVWAVDVSERALAMARHNAEINGLSGIRLERADLFRFLEQRREAGDRFRVVILDPPRFARSRRALNQAIRGYHSLNELALSVLEEDGLLVTCSCSGQVGAEAFSAVIGAAAQRANRCVQILERRGQAPDHPVSAFCPETAYLKCFICRAD